MRKLSFLLTYFVFFIPMLSGAFLANADNGCIEKVSTEDRTMTYDVSMEGLVGSGSYSAYQLVSNRHHLVGVCSNSGYLRATIIGNRLWKDEHEPSNDSPLFKIDGGLDIVVPTNGDHQGWLHQLYASVSWKKLYLEVGQREQSPALRNEFLSSGSLISSGNAKPMPEVRIGTEDFVTIPWTHHWLQFIFDASYGRFMDDDWLEDQYSKYYPRIKNSWITTGAWYHQKKLLFRTNPNKLFSLTFGAEHAVQFGGKQVLQAAGKEYIAHSGSKLKDFIKVIIPTGGDGSLGSSDDRSQEWVQGNHLGEWSLLLDWNIDYENVLSAYVECPFEDGSGMRKGNGWDGLWGFEYKNRKSGVQYIRGLVVEYLDMTDQSGPMHWQPDDYQSLQGHITKNVTGNDNYYNNYFYNGYAHFGMALGSPLLKSPIYNEDGFLNFVDNRVRAWHVGAMGEFSTAFSYRLLASYREGLGTYFVPFVHKHHSFDSMVQIGWHNGPWQCSAALGVTQGNVYGDCTTFNFKIGYHGKIL